MILQKESCITPFCHCEQVLLVLVLEDILCLIDILLFYMIDVDSIFLV